MQRFTSAWCSLTSDWGDAIFERGWVHFQLSEYGKSLGAVHSLSAPFFAENAQHVRATC